jgi:hypothetical protein
MKKITIILSGLFILFTTGCEKYVSDDDIDPNNPVDVPVTTLLTTTEVTIFATQNGQMSRDAGLFVQHFEGTLFQMIEHGSYSISENDVQNDWNTSYTSGIANALRVIKKGNELGSPYYVGVGEACKAMLLGQLTDYWGDIPNREAGLGEEGTFYPHYDAQSVVLEDIQTLLTDAITQLSKDPGANQGGIMPGSDDLIHGGDAAAWISTCWVLKARYHNRLSQVDPVVSATNALADIDGLTATGGSGDAYAKYGTEGGTALNPWFAFNSDRTDYIKLSATLVDSMRSMGDPRLPFYADPILGDSAFIGSGLGSEDVNASYLNSTWFAAADADLPLVTGVEASFIEAEAAFRSGNIGRAQTAFTQGITSSIGRFGADPTAYLAAHGTLNAGTEMQQIMTQKWIALFTQCEVWADWRRTGIPSLTPNPAGVQGSIPVRYPTEQNERLLNPNAVVISDLTTPVWWDQ